MPPAVKPQQQSDNFSARVYDEDNIEIPTFRQVKPLVFAYRVLGKPLCLLSTFYHPDLKMMVCLRTNPVRFAGSG
ncbi:MAG: hypothetical protein U0703_10940 [Anaerolineae bacterium]